LNDPVRCPFRSQCGGVRSTLLRAAAAKKTHDQGDKKQHQEDKKEDLGDLGSPCRDSAKAKQRGKDRDDEEHDCEVKHL
jgi:hypothetical protein